jgi:3-hydroxyacyl-[acyl-carrier protein] dehydratase/trans-2-decenoyl-[acyl-carrier protein] isomerase
VTFRGQITPQTKLVTYEINMKRVIRRSLHMGIGDGVVKADGVPIYTATDLKVGLFSAEQLEAQMK